MISPFLIYIVLQLDTVITIGGMLIAAMFLVIAFITLLLTDVRSGTDTYNKLTHRRLIATIVLVVATGFVTFLPSTKTAAAMIVIPAIVNNPHVQQDAKQLYQLAEQALHNAVADQTPKK